MPARAFTLIEVMAVVLLLGLLAGATAWSLAGEAHRATREDAIEQIAGADRQMRTAARRMNVPCVLLIDLESQQVQRRVGRENDPPDESHAINIGTGCRIDRVLLGDSAGGLSDARQVEIACSPSGITKTYALRVSDDRTGEYTWLLIAGLTGQMVRLHHENEVQNILDLSPGRPHVD